MANRTNYPDVLSDGAPTMKEQARDSAGELLERANEVGSRTMSAVGSGLQGVAKKLEDSDAPEGVRGKVAESLTGAARYLEDADPKSIFMKVDSAIQAHPYRAIAACLGIAWVVGRMARR